MWKASSPYVLSTLWFQWVNESPQILFYRWICHISWCPLKHNAYECSHIKHWIMKWEEIRNVGTNPRMVESAKIVEKKKDILGGKFVSSFYFLNMPRVLLLDISRVWAWMLQEALDVISILNKDSHSPLDPCSRLNFPSTTSTWRD